MFVEYGIALYPVYVTLDEDIAAEIEEQEEIICETQQEFESKLEKILNSSKLKKIISNLLGLAKMRKRDLSFELSIEEKKVWRTIKERLQFTAQPQSI